jgi:tetratricopeptide (TPR) repeat protein
VRPVFVVVSGLSLLAALVPPAEAQPSLEDSTEQPVQELELRPLSGPKADVAALILTGSESGSLRAAALAVPRCEASASAAADGQGREKRKSRVDLWLEIEGASLLESANLSDGLGAKPPESLRLEMYSYAVTPSGEIAASLSRWVRLPLVEVGDRLRDGGIKLASHLLLEPGDYQIRVLLRDSRSHRFALRLLRTTVPDPEGRKPHVSPPFFPDVESAWVLAREPGSEALEEAAARPEQDPWVSRLPAALPVLSTAREWPLRLQGCRLADASFDARLLEIGGKPLAEPELLLGQALDRAGSQLLEARVKLPELEPGTYVLEISAESAKGSSVVDLPVFVPPPGWEEMTLAWTAVNRMTTEPESRQRALELAARQRGSKRVAAIADAYRGVLEHLASGDLDEAASRLQRLESEVMAAGKKPARSHNWLNVGENRVTQELLDRDPECLFPLLLLHLETYRRYVVEGGTSPFLLSGARTRVRALANLYATEAKHAMAPSLAAISLVELGSILEQAQQLESALAALREALALDQENAQVLLDLAYQYEHRGLRQNALDMLDRLLEIEPRSDEGRLRLAVNLAHLGRREEEAELLRQIIADGASEWVLAVAYQELGRLLLQQERPEDAVQLLEEGVARLPSVQRLYIELAYALDRSGQRRLGQETAARIPAAAGRFSPRLLYRFPPRTGDSRSRDSLVRHSTARLPALSRALAENEETS